MYRKDKPRSSWESAVSFPQKFSYEVDAPLETVTHHLGEMEQEPMLFRRSSQEMSLLPVQGHYVFRVRRRRHGTLTTSAEGQIWQDETGCVIIEGETRVNGWSWIVSLILISLFGIVTSVLSMPAVSRPILLIPFFITMVIGFGMSFTIYRQDRTQLISQLDEIVTSIKQTPSQGKQKRASRLALEDSNINTDRYEEDVDMKKNQR